MFTTPAALKRPSEVHPGLWLAGSRWPYPDDLEIDLLVTLCCRYEIHYDPPAKREVTLAMRDASIDGATEAEIHALAREVADAVTAGQRVMVRCQWGVERSGMVAALALRMLTDQPFAAVLRLLRARRSRHVLFNPESSAWAIARGRLPRVNPTAPR